MRSKIKKLLSIVLCTLIFVSAIEPAVFAVNYPEGITKEKSLNAVSSADSAVLTVSESLSGKSLKELFSQTVYSDDTMSSLFLGIYGELSKNEKELKYMNLDVSVENVAKGLGSYPSIQKELSKYSSFSEIQQLKGKWNIKTKDDFSFAVSAVLSPFNELLYALLCSGSCKIGNVVGIHGGEGYQNAIIPILDNFGVKKITETERFKADAASNKAYMLYYIVYDLMTLCEEVCENPVDTLTDILPNIANYLKGDGLNSAVSKLIEPLTLQLWKFNTFIKIKWILMLITDPNALLSSLDINEMTSSLPIKLADIDLEELSSCGTLQGEKVVSDKGDAFLTILRWLIETLKLNSDKLDEFSLPEDAGNISSVLDGLLSKSTDELVSLVIELLSQREGKILEYQWQFKDFTPGEVTFNEDMPRERYESIVKKVDPLIDEFIASSGEYKTLKAMLSQKIYSSDTVTKIAGAVYSLFESEDMKDIGALLGMEISPKELAKSLPSSYYSAKSKLSYYSSWKNAQKANINWGFKTGDSKGFTKALCAVLDPLEPFVNMLLAGNKCQIMGINFYGSNGYNTAVIPLLEAVGVPSKYIPDYSSFKKQADKNNSIEPIAEAVVSFLNIFMKKPVYTLTSILPNLLYFVENDGIAVCIENLLYPVTDIFEKLGMELPLDLSSLKNIDINALVLKTAKSFDLGLDFGNPDVASLGKLGKAETKKSKRTFEGKRVKVTYIEADQPAILKTSITYIVELLGMEENAGAFDSMLGATSDGNDMFETYSSGITEQMQEMTTDETVAWLCNLLFRERAVREEKPKDDYLPTIIYEKKQVNKTAVLIASILLIVALAEIIYIKKKDEISRLIRNAKEDRAIKKRLKDEYENRNKEA